MAITITLSDADSDGTGINFTNYLKKFDKNYQDDSGRSGFNGKVTGSYFETDNPLKADGYASTEDMDGGGRSVLFDGPSSFIYSAAAKYQGIAHNVYGEVSSITFGGDTVVKELNDAQDSVSYSNSEDITISGFPAGYMSTVGNKGQLMHDLVDGSTKSLLAYLNKNSIELIGSDGNDRFTGFNKGDTLDGGAGNDRLDGGKGADTIIGGLGNDTLIGGKGADTFIFAAGDGNDKIKDFGASGADVIDFGDLFTDFSSMKADHMTASSAGVTIDYDGGTLLLQGLKISDLSADDFLFAV